MQNTKKKSFIVIAVMVCLFIVAAAAGITLATLMTDTEKRANAFTFGNVQIELDETEWSKLKPEQKILYPGKTIKKDPKVKNTGKNDLYAYIEVKMPKKTVKTVTADVNGNDIIQDADLHELFSYTVGEGWTQISCDDSGADYNVYLYAYTKEILTPGSITLPLFKNVKYINILEGELEMNTVIEMPITAYAIQSEYLDENGSDLKTKMKNAFDKYKSEIDG